MKRANGHLASVIRMMEEGAGCESVLTQLAAVNTLPRSGPTASSAVIQEATSKP